MTSRESPPSRQDIELRWRSVASGAASRESVHDWAEPFVLAEDDTISDPMVMTALQYLHGFDMVWRSGDRRFVGHGPPGPYLRSLEEITAELDRWLHNCHGHDADPIGWLERARSRRASGTRVVRGSFPFMT
jgi:hypothetical protein